MRKRNIQVLQVLQLTKLWPQRPRNVRVAQIPKIEDKKVNYKKFIKEIDKQIWTWTTNTLIKN